MSIRPPGIRRLPSAVISSNDPLLKTATSVAGICVTHSAGGRVRVWPHLAQRPEAPVLGFIQRLFGVAELVTMEQHRLASRRISMAYGETELAEDLETAARLDGIAL
jgi:hypothetical protein